MKDTLTNVICSIIVGLMYKHLYAFVAAVLKKVLS